MAQPFALIGAVLGMNAKQVVGSALHPAGARVEIGNARVARILARERHAQPEQTCGRRKREVQRVAAVARGLVASPQRHQARLERACFLAHRAQLAWPDRSVEGRERTRNGRGLEDKSIHSRH